MFYSEADIKACFLCLSQQIDSTLSDKDRDLEQVTLNMIECVVLDLNRIACALEDIAERKT